MKNLLLLNGALACVVLVLLPLVFKYMPRLAPHWGFPIALLAYMAAAALLHDFAMRGASSAALPVEIDLYQSYLGALYHTVKHPLWPIALNVFFSLAFTALLVQSRGLAPVPMALWLVVALAVPTAITIFSRGFSAFAEMSWNLRIAFVLALLACVFFLKDGFTAK